MVGGQQVFGSNGTVGEFGVPLLQQATRQTNMLFTSSARGAFSDFYSPRCASPAINGQALGSSLGQGHSDEKT
jgi:hypothetical protein